MKPNKKNLFDYNLDDMINSLKDMLGDTEPLIEDSKSGKDKYGDWTSDSLSTPSGSIVIKTFYRTNSTNKGINKLDELKFKLSEAVQTDNYEEAIILRDKIKNLENNADKISELNNKLSAALESQNYEDAIKLRDELKKLK